MSLFLHYSRVVRDLLVSEERSLQEELFRESATINKEKAVLKECLNNSQLAREEKEVERERERERMREAIIERERVIQRKVEKETVRKREREKERESERE